MDIEDGEKGQLVSYWHTLIKKGTDYDQWGQPIEAKDAYQKLMAHILEETKFEDRFFTDTQRKVLNKVAACLELRSSTLMNPGKLEDISLDDLKLVANNFKSLLCSDSKSFPIDVTDLQSKSRKEKGPLPPKASVDDEGGDENEMEAVAKRKLEGTLLPKPPNVNGETIVTVRIEKIGLKDASQYLDSYITVSVRDATGNELCPSQDTPVALHKDDTSVLFGVDVYMPVTLEQLPEDFAVVFEFKHYKPKKKQLSTKCWAFMEKDEFKESQSVIELYKKPTDFKRKKIKLLTEKPLYLHLKITLDN